ncbi:MAG: prolipoprotein diacylglyceryl transferase [Clostridiales bacterium]|nr:prolipoprotein diacylglyceryl transferase [Clostridiales bacterium]
MELEFVEFPGLGLKIPVSRTAFRLFGQDVYTYAVIIAFAIALMIFLGLRQSERYGIRQDMIIDMMIFALPSSIVCARLYYVIFSWDSYRGDLLAIINIRNGGLAIYGAVIGAFLAVFIFSRVRKISPFIILDFGVPYLLLAQGIGRWGNFVNQEAFGTNTTLPWGMTSSQIVSYLANRAEGLAAAGIIVDPAMPVHPTFLYESLWNVLIAVVLFQIRRHKKFNGEVLFCYLIGYGAGRAFIEGLRTDSLMLGSFRVSQLLSILLVVLCAALFLVFRKVSPPYQVAPILADGEPVGDADDDVDVADEADTDADVDVADEAATEGDVDISGEAAAADTEEAVDVDSATDEADTDADVDADDAVDVPDGEAVDAPEVLKP